ncbi:chromosomal replication initiator protein DnaA [bacterium]|nr:chromosomal replication initiator protein DnaA [bacterium]
MEDLTIKEIWEKVLEILKDNIVATSYNSWVLPLVPHSFEDNCFCVLTGNSLAVDLLNKDKKKITSALSQICGKEVLFKVVYDEDLRKKIELEQKKAKKEEDREYIKNLEKRIKPSKYDGLMQMQSDCHLNLKYKFENFVVGANNKFAYAAALEVANKPGQKYNPLFIYGGSGLGKTHLLQAIGADIMFHKQNLKVKYIKTEEFINDLINSIYSGADKANDRNKKMNDFRNKYRNVDVLLIDDIQLIEGKERTEEEIFNTFDSLYNSGKQIVITSDRPPEELKNSPERLKSRFQMGLLADVQVPDTETRMAILKKLAEDNNTKLSQDVISFLASVYNKNIRELEGAFNRVSAFASINELSINIDTVKKIIGYKENRKAVTMEGIIDIVAGYYNVSVSDVKSASREAGIAKARNVAAYLIREMTDDSFPAIGLCFNRKHTTIMHSYDKIKSDVVTDRRVAQEIRELTDKINN